MRLLALCCALLVSACATVSDPLVGTHKEPFWDVAAAAPHPTGWSLEKRGTVAGVAGWVGLLVTLERAGRGLDKAAHCAGGATVSTVAGLIWQPKVGAAWTVGLGLAKEAYDANGGGEPDWRDAAATLGCGAIPYFILSQ